MGESYATTHEDVSDRLGKYLVSACFQDGYTKCQEDMAVKIKEAYKQGLLEGYACMPSIEGMPLINSLNKQD